MATGKEIAELVQRRDKVRESIQRVRGRLDSARQEQMAVEEECRKRKVDPDKIDAVITQLEQRLETEISGLTSELEQAEAQVKPYLEEDK